MTSIVDILIRTTDESSGANEGIVGSLTEINSAISLAKQAWQGLDDVYKQTIGTTLSYAQDVRQLSEISGQSSEMTSKMIDLTGRYGVTVQNLDMASKTLAKEGLPLTINTLADLSDQYNSLGTAAQQTSS